METTLHRQLKALYAGKDALVEQQVAGFRIDAVRDGAKVRALKGELDEHQTALPQLYEHWEEAAELNG